MIWASFKRSAFHDSHSGQKMVAYRVLMVKKDKRSFFALGIQPLLHLFYPRNHHALSTTHPKAAHSTEQDSARAIKFLHTSPCGFSSDRSRMQVQHSHLNYAAPSEMNVTTPHSRTSKLTLSTPTRSRCNSVGLRIWLKPEMTVTIGRQVAGRQELVGSGVFIIEVQFWWQNEEMYTNCSLTRTFCMNRRCPEPRRRGSVCQQTACRYIRLQAISEQCGTSRWFVALTSRLLFHQC